MQRVVFVLGSVTIFLLLFLIFTSVIPIFEPFSSSPSSFFNVSSQNAFATSNKLGDANGDGIVDDRDYTIWLLHVGQTVTDGARSGDFNGDGVVDNRDRVIVLKAMVL